MRDGQTEPVKLVYGSRILKSIWGAPLHKGCDISYLYMVWDAGIDNRKQFIVGMRNICLIS